MATTEQTRDTTARIVVEGTIDEAGAERLASQLATVRQGAYRDVVLDFRAVQHIGSAGMGQLLLLYKHVASHGGTVRIEHASPTVRELLRIVKIDDLMTVA